jgi:peroxin-12
MTDANDVVNPTSVGGLLAEEWTINPYASLPSFLEMILIEQATNSTQNLVASAMDAVEEKVSQHLLLTSHSDIEPPAQGRGSLQRLYSVARDYTTRTQFFFLYLLRKYKYELVGLLIYSLERQRLYSSSCATVSESLYGTKRVKLENGGKLTDLTDQDKTRVALLRSLIPYIQIKLDRMPMNKWGRILYIIARSVLRLANLGCRWRFLVGQSIFYDLPCLLLGHVVRRVAQSDLPSDANDNSSSGGLLSSNNNKRSMLYFVSASILVSWMTQIRAEWDNYKRQQHCRDASIVPPPPPWPSRGQSHDHCPICRKQRVLPTASTSGFVYCFQCILPHVQRHGTCPVTGVACPEERLVRLYEQ